MSDNSSQDYQHLTVEPKWLQAWEEAGLFQDSLADDQDSLQLSREEFAQRKMYLLFAFAYPSGSGLHVGHVESNTALDILARYYRMQGKEVFFPVGWDAFGLPAENYAVKTGVHPAKTTKKAIDTFRRQLKKVGISYDWANEIATCHPGYYRWTQWLFKQLYQAGLAYRDIGMVNWCPSCKTVLANEQVVEGLCERCDAEVEQKELEQWYFQITEYKDELIEGLDQVDWPEATKRQQKNWIGRSQGVDVDFKLADPEGKPLDINVTCFTTRIDTIFGASFIVISPEKFKQLNLTGQLSEEKAAQVEAYLARAFKKTEEQRRIGERDKTGVDTGLKAINPVNGEELPVFAADYVLADVGSSVVMGVPAHDERDWDFAKKYQLPIVPVITPQGRELQPDECYTGCGQMINSGEYTGLTSQEGREQLVEDFGHVMEKTTTYKLRDWLISRQRYWGAPIPVIYDPDGQPHLIKDQDLPWELPEDIDFNPTGESPLTSSQEFASRAQDYARENFADLIEQHQEDDWQADASDWRPEFDTMDTFVDSSWYYLRYLDSRNTDQFARGARMNKWLPVDFYLIGPEHIVLHLLYSRFFTKFLCDQGYLDLPSGEPFQKMRHQGMILGPDHKKMSKSKGNVISPDDIIEQYGADTLRVYEMFMGPLEIDKPWDDRAVQGVRRFLNKMYKLVSESAEAADQGLEVETPDELQRKLHQTLRKAANDLPELKFNTAIAALMEFSNAWRSWLVHEREQKNHPGLSESDAQLVVMMLAPLAPFLAEELWERLGQDFSVHQQSWPKFDPELAQQEQVVIPIQINGKIRGELKMDVDTAEDKNSENEILERAKKLDSVQKWLKNKKIKKEIFVPGQIVSFVMK